MALPSSQRYVPPGYTFLTDAAGGPGVGGVNTYGQQYADIEGRKPTYRGGILALAPPATPQDFFTLTGSPLVVARLLMVEVWIGATAAAAMELALRFNSIANTGGTATVPVAVSADPADAAAACALAAYTVAPTPGTSLGIIAAGRACGPILAGAGSSYPLVWEFGVQNDKAPVLRTAAQQIALNGNGAALPGGILFSVRFTWSEEQATGN
ncbi:MAG TPA: hypothetical protein VNW90_10705 [Acetobacteraceae bacterium]|jgi:hypothetical protein|nr:hypothetical protein [Acetobacteraceae bacterium]